MRIYIKLLHREKKDLERGKEGALGLGGGGLEAKYCMTTGKKRWVLISFFLFDSLPFLQSRAEHNFYIILKRDRM